MLPDRIVNKIRITPSGCHEWTGAVRRPAPRIIPRTESEALRPRGPYKPTEDGSYPPVCITVTKPVPLVRHLGRVRPARRVVYALHTGVSIDDLPAVRSTCGNPLCVSPDHSFCVLSTPVTLAELEEDQMPGVSLAFLRSEYPGRTISQDTFDAFQSL